MRLKGIIRVKQKKWKTTLFIKQLIKQNPLKTVTCSVRCNLASPDFAIAIKGDETRLISACLFCLTVNHTCTSSLRQADMHFSNIVGGSLNVVGG